MIIYYLILSIFHKLKLKHKLSDQLIIRLTMMILNLIVLIDTWLMILKCP